MRIYEDKSLSDQSFVLEESVFMRCTLKNCDLFYSGGDFEFVELKLDNCRFHFRGPAKNTQMLCLTLGMLRDPSQLPKQVTMSSQKPN
jgi:hypothetical protein